MSQSNNRRIVTVSDVRLAKRCARGRVVLIDDDAEILSALSALIELEGYACETYSAAPEYLRVLNYNRPCFPGPSCVVCDVKMPELDGLELQSRLASMDDTPFLLMSGSSGVQEAVSAFRAGAVDFLIKPIDVDVLLAAVAKALAESTGRQARRHRRAEQTQLISSLTEREHDILRRVARGQTNPAIAAELGIALRTVKLHRQRAMEKIGAGGTADLVRIAGELEL